MTDLCSRCNNTHACWSPVTSICIHINLHHHTVHEIRFCYGIKYSRNSVLDHSFPLYGIRMHLTSATVDHLLSGAHCCDHIVPNNSTHLPVATVQQKVVKLQSLCAFTAVQQHWSLDIIESVWSWPQLPRVHTSTGEQYCLLWATSAVQQQCVTEQSQTETENASVWIMMNSIQHWSMYDGISVIQALWFEGRGFLTFCILYYKWIQLLNHVNVKVVKQCYQKFFTFCSTIVTVLSSRFPSVFWHHWLCDRKRNGLKITGANYLQSFSILQPSPS